MAVIQKPTDPNAKAITAQQTGPNGAPLQTIGTAAPAGQAPVGSSQAKPQQGSGRFTNIQKYLGANKSAGQQVAGQVGQGLQKQFTEQSNKAQDYYTKLGQSIDQSKTAAEQGQGFQQKLQGFGTTLQSQKIGPQVTAEDTGFAGQYKALETGTPEEKAKHQNAALQAYNAQREIDAVNQIRAGQEQALAGIEQFAQDPGFADYQRFQSGQAIDENLMSLQQQRANQAALAATQGAQQAQQTLGTEAGRFNLLRKQFASGPRSGYTQGQQRLDQVFLGQGGGLSGLQTSTAEQARKNLELAKQASAKQTDVNTLAAQERSLIDNLNTQAKANEQAYIDALASYGGATQELRNREFEDLGKSLSAYTEKFTPAQDKTAAKYEAKAYDPNNAGLTDEQMKRLGLTDKNQGVYNVFKDQAFREAQADKNNANIALARVIANKGQEVRRDNALATAQDVANERDVARYKALAKMRGANAPEAITQASTLGEAWTNRAEPDASLKARLQNAQTAFEKAVKDSVSYQGTLRDKAGETWDGKNTYRYGNVQSNANLEDLINKGRAAITTRVTGDKGLGNRLLDKSSNDLVNQFKDFINEQNYNRTLGGRRETFLDTENRAKQAEVQKDILQKITQPDFAITGADPSLKYKGLGTTTYDSTPLVDNARDVETNPHLVAALGGQFNPLVGNIIRDTGELVNNFSIENAYNTANEYGAFPVVDNFNTVKDTLNDTKQIVKNRLDMDRLKNDPTSVVKDLVNPNRVIGDVAKSAVKNVGKSVGKSLKKIKKKFKL